MNYKLLMQAYIRSFYCLYDFRQIAAFNGLLSDLLNTMSCMELILKSTYEIFNILTEEEKFELSTDPMVKMYFDHVLSSYSNILKLKESGVDIDEIIKKNSI